MITDLPPTLNQSYCVHRYGKRAGIGMTEEAKAFKERIGWEAYNAFGRLAPNGVYEARIVQHLPNRRRRDVDANVKLVLDAVCAGCGIDDSRVFKVTLEKVIDGHGYLEVEIWPREGEQTMMNI